MYVVEVKGTGYLDTTRTKKEVEILKKLLNSGYKVIFLLDATIDNKIYKKAKNFTDMLNNNDLENH